jgi:hypothetical protein
MIPHINMYEQLAQERRQDLLREAEQQRKAAEGQHAPPPHSSRRLVARLAKYLILFGTRLQRAQAIE